MKAQLTEHDYIADSWILKMLLWLGLLGLSLLTARWGFAVLGSLLLAAQAYDAHALRKLVRSGRVWVYQGRVEATRGGCLLLVSGNSRVCLCVDRTLPVRIGEEYRIAVEHSGKRNQLLAIEHSDHKPHRARIALLPLAAGV